MNVNSNIYIQFLYNTYPAQKSKATISNYLTRKIRPLNAYAQNKNNFSKYSRIVAGICLCQVNYAASICLCLGGLLYVGKNLKK